MTAYFVSSPLSSNSSVSFFSLLTFSENTEAIRKDPLWALTTTSWQPPASVPRNSPFSVPKDELMKPLAKNYIPICALSLSLPRSSISPPSLIIISTPTSFTGMCQPAYDVCHFSRLIIKRPLLTPLHPLLLSPHDFTIPFYRKPQGCLYW